MLSEWEVRYWYVIRMHDTMMIKIYTWIFIVLLRNSSFIYIYLNYVLLPFWIMMIYFYYELFYIFIYIYIGFEMKLVEHATW